MTRLIGVTQIHTGTAVGKLTGSKKEAVALGDILRERKAHPGEGILLEQDWGNIKCAFPSPPEDFIPASYPMSMKSTAKRATYW